jgi:Integrase core domain
MRFLTATTPRPAGPPGNSSRRSRNDSAPRFLLRDRDAIYGEAFGRGVKGMGIREILTAPRKPWQNPFVERVIGSIRRECLISAASCAPTSPTTTPRAHTNRSTTTVPSPESSIPRRVAASSPCLRSAGFIIATSAPPDHLDHDPTSHPSSGPAGCRRLCGDPWSRLRPPPPCGPSHLQQRQCGLRLRTVEPWSHRDTGADEVSNYTQS